MERGDLLSGLRDRGVRNDLKADLMLPDKALPGDLERNRKVEALPVPADVAERPARAEEAEVGVNIGQASCGKVGDVLKRGSWGFGTGRGLTNLSFGFIV